jgi:ParB-like chromosome segregation protein Spo0J
LENQNLKIEYLPVDSLKPYSKNARKHSEKDIQAIINSIEEFGFDDPIGIWSNQNIIVEGHGRLIAAKRLGMEKVPCIRLDHLTDEQRKAYALAHNKTAELSKWFDELLQSELAEIEDIDMELFGFDLDAVAEKEEEPGEIPFTEELMLTHNYIVLYFDNDFDWEVAQEKFGLQKVKDLIPRKGQPTGIGRVINGREVLKWQS